MNHLTISLLKIPKPAVFQQKIQFDFKYGAGCSKINSAEGIKPPEVNTRGLSTCAFKMYLHFQELTLSKSILLALKKGLLRPKRKILMISYLILSRISRFCFKSLIPYSLPLSCKKGNPKDRLQSSLVQ